MTTTLLFGKLKEHELEMNKLFVQENEDKHVRSIALKTVGHRRCQESSNDSDEDTFNLLSKKFSKLLKKKNNKNHSSNRYSSKKLNDLTLTSIPVLAVVSRDTSKQIVPTVRTKRKQK